MPRYVRGFDIAYKGPPKVTIDHQQVITFHQNVINQPPFLEISHKSEHSFTNMVIYTLFIECCESHLRTVVKSTEVPKLKVFFTFLFHKLMKSNQVVFVYFQ